MKHLEHCTTTIAVVNSPNHIYHLLIRNRVTHDLSFTTETFISQILMTALYNFNLLLYLPKPRAIAFSSPIDTYMCIFHHSLTLMTVFDSIDFGH
ncbi:hypothetical protein Hanom_Chr06g00502741 [Helianthus anomalus]